VFFVGKKDGNKRIVQDYQYLNKRTIKDNYLLPLILDLIDTIGTKRVFTKMDLWWGYNNVQVKEKDEWKAVFTMYLEVYKPTVMFFGLTNSPATFQVMMNDILRDLLNTGEVVVFMDNVLVGTDKEKGHNEIVSSLTPGREFFLGGLASTVSCACSYTCPF